MGGKGRGKGKKRNKEGKEGKGEVCVMAFGGWTPLHRILFYLLASRSKARRYKVLAIGAAKPRPRL